MHSNLVNCTNLTVDFGIYSFYSIYNNRIYAGMKTYMYMYVRNCICIYLSIDMYLDDECQSKFEIFIFIWFFIIFIFLSYMTYGVNSSELNEKITMHIENMYLDLFNK